MIYKINVENTISEGLCARIFNKFKILNVYFNILLRETNIKVEAVSYNNDQRVRYYFIVDIMYCKVTYVCMSRHSGRQYNA